MLPSKWSSTWRACGVRSPQAETLPEETRSLRARRRRQSMRCWAAGLPCAALHEMSAPPLHLGAAAGFALALAALAREGAKETLWIATDFGSLETGALYGPGLDQFGLATERLLIARVARPVDALFAMEEALKCRALAAVIAELPRRAGPHRDAPALARRARRWRPRPRAPPHADARRRARRARAGRSRPRRACRMSSAGSAAPPSRSRSPATAAAPAATGLSPGITMSASSRRYLSVWLRRLPTDRIAKRLHSAEALVIAAPVKGALRLSAVNDAAAALGLRVGMPLADARAMHPTDRGRGCGRARRSRAARSDRRLVRPLYAAGRARSAGRLAARHHRLRASVRRRDGARARSRAAAWRRGLAARVAVAGYGRVRVGRGAVSARSRSASHRVRSRLRTRRRRARPPPPRGVALSPETVAALAQVGLKHIADVLDRPRAPLAARFGQDFVRRHRSGARASRTSRSRRACRCRPLLPSSAFPNRSRTRATCSARSSGSRQRLAHVLEQRGEGARLLQVALFRADGKVFRIEAGTGAPLRDRRASRRLFADRLAVIGDEAIRASASTWCGSRALVTERTIRSRPGSRRPITRRTSRI